jgi:hypothetical protein
MFECHVTTAPPISEESHNNLVDICNAYNFRIARLYMKTGSPSTKDAFMTFKSDDYGKTYANMVGLIDTLNKCGFDVWRYKIEKILFDSKIGDRV